jgi:hypothetical protein
MLGTLLANAQMSPGPDTERTFGEGLPRDHDTLVFADDQYPEWPLTPEQQVYSSIDGTRMKRQVVDLADIALEYRDEGHQWWGRLPGTSADRASMDYMTRAFEDLGLSVDTFPFTLPTDWRPRAFSASYTVEGSAAHQLSTVFPVARTKATWPEGLTADAVWVGIGSGADFIGRDVAGKAVVIYSVFVPGGRSHSASDRAGLFDANTRAVELGAAAIINVMAVPGNGQFQPEGGVADVPHFTLSMDEGFALKEHLDNGEAVSVHLTLEVDELVDLQTAYTVATLPGMSDEQIVIMTHTDGYFTAALDNASGMASALELARFYASKPIEQRPRTLKFIQFPDHHHGEVSLRNFIDEQWPWDTVAVKLTMEHPSQTLLFMYNDSLTPTNAVGAFRWNALGSERFERMIFDTFREFGVSLYAMEDRPKNGSFAPSFHIIDHVIYHTSLDVPELVPATGLERATRAFAAALDRANEMTLEELRGVGFPFRTGQGSVNGTGTLID